MKETYLNFKLNKIMETNLEIASKKFGMSRSEVGRRALWMFYDAYLDPVEMGKSGIRYNIKDVVKDVLKEERSIEKYGQEENKTPIS